jgi:signal transduction histidine kinase
MQHENKESAGADGAASTPEQRIAQMRLLLSRLDAAHDAQHQTLARELHHKVVGSLSALKMECDWLLRPQRSDDAMRPRLQRLSEELGTTIQFTRHLINELWPAIVSHLGLSSAVQQQLADARSRTDASIELLVEGDVDDIPEARAIELYRLIQHVLDQCTAQPRAVCEVCITLRRKGAAVELHIELDPTALPADALLLMDERVSRVGGRLARGVTPKGKSSIDVVLSAAS